MQNAVIARKSASDLHIARLDTIRFLAALWVAIGHGAIPLRPLADRGTAAWLALALVDSSFCGVAAVMVFFIVSGLCIHLPYSGKSSVPLSTFLVRRYLRIGLPLVIMLLATRFLGNEAEERLGAVTWSLYAELFFYSVYPILFRMAQHWGWTPQIAVSSLIAVTISLCFVHETVLRAMGWYVWLWGLPIWISGCVMADWFRSGRFPSILGSVWIWRGLAWAVSVVAIWLLSHSPVKVNYQFSMFAFAPIAFVWLVKELSSPANVWNALERCGAASYSLYLVHFVALGELAQHGPMLSAPVALLLRVSTIAIAAAVFYFVVEAPSHRLARNASRAVASFEVSRWKSGTIDRGGP